MDLMTIEEVSRDYRIPANTLRFWRQRREGPPSFKLGRRVMYRRADVDAWIEAQVQADAQRKVGA